MSLVKITIHDIRYRGGQRFATVYCTSFKTNSYVNTEGAL